MLAGCGGGGDDGGQAARSRTATARSAGEDSPPLGGPTRTTPGPAGTGQPDTNAGPDGQAPNYTPGGPSGPGVPIAGLPTATPLRPSGLTLELVVPATVPVGQTVQGQVRIRGSTAERIGAFNFDLVYDESQVRLGVPAPSDAVLSGTEREFSCDLPPPSADVEPVPSVGRARLACFSFGDATLQGLESPSVLATISLRPLVPGTIALRWDAVGMFAWDGANLGTVVEVQPRITAR